MSSVCKNFRDDFLKIRFCFGSIFGGFKLDSRDDYLIWRYFSIIEKLFCWKTESHFRYTNFYYPFSFKYFFSSFVPVNFYSLEKVLNNCTDFFNEDLDYRNDPEITVSYRVLAVYFAYCLVTASLKLFHSIKKIKLLICISYSIHFDIHLT